MKRIAFVSLMLLAICQAEAQLTINYESVLPSSQRVELLEGAGHIYHWHEALNFDVNPVYHIAPEGFDIYVDKDLITVRASSTAGAFYGEQMIRKLVLAAQMKARLMLAENPSAINNGISEYQFLFPAAHIESSPALRWRGMMLDVARHTFPLDYIKKFIDQLALHQMNVFHWHLTDDQGWRMEVKRYPKLTAGQEHFTQDEIREVVEYARQRHITVVPEIDMPGHMMAALAAYPELGCTGGPYELPKGYGVFDDVLCVGQPKVMEFVKNVLTEVMELFPSEYIHVGGDECPRVRWQQCPRCQSFISAHHIEAKGKLSKEDCLQGYFMNEVQKFLQQHNRRMIGWDEMMDSNAPKGATLMAWRGDRNGYEAAEAGHDVIMTPVGYTYLSNRGLYRLGGDRSIKKALSLNVRPDSLSVEARNHLFGVQGCIWTERVETPERCEWLLLPRLSAIAEVGWHADKRDADAFMQRVYDMLLVYDAIGARNYSRDVYNITPYPKVDLKQGEMRIELKTLNNRPIHYTLDGQKPTTSSPLYTGPISVQETVDLQAQVVSQADSSDICQLQVDVNKATFCPITFNSTPWRTHTYGGAPLLVNGLHGTTDFADEAWVGFGGNNVDLTIDLREAKEISTVGITSCIAVSSAVMDFIGFRVMVSDDGEKFTEVYSNDIPALGEKDANLSELRRHECKFSPVSARFVRIVGFNNPRLPAWHKWAGSTCFVFLDEVEIE
ncbi:MAG: family 20 glycosylhydrolase [Prevotella sp.]|nr:family 20 glycosylhydrolase [Prevotella sp.]